jgi:hypothetical protein
MRGDACDLEAAQEAVGGRGEPGAVAGFERDEAGVRGLRVELAECGEELVGEAFVVLE